MLGAEFIYFIGGGDTAVCGEFCPVALAVEGEGVWGAEGGVQGVGWEGGGGGDFGGGAVEVGGFGVGGEDV